MKEKVQEILERELAKLDQMSLNAADGLDLPSVRRLEVLIKCYSAFIGPLENRPDPNAPGAQPTEKLLEELRGGIHK